ncbi:MAG: ATP-dependent sacrificial sulfur transferase LarE [Aureliella sp.]
MSSSSNAEVGHSVSSRVDDTAADLLSWFDLSQQYVVALSGGVDSSVVAEAVSRSGATARLVTANSAAVSSVEISDVEKVCGQIDLPHEFLLTGELSVDGYTENGASRCYFCKSELFRQITARFPEAVILTGTNLDDLSDFRPGLKAAAEHSVRSPLAELKISKRQVRELANLWQLHVADKPASPCLASRIAHGVSVTRERLARIEAAEATLRKLGLVDCRVRLHEGELARIEVCPADFDLVCSKRDALADEFIQLGFRYVTLDLQPLRSGSQNAVYGIQVNTRPER